MICFKDAAFTKRLGTEKEVSFFDGWMDGSINGRWANGQMDGQISRWMNVFIIKVITSLIKMSLD